MAINKKKVTILYPPTYDSAHPKETTVPSDHFVAFGTHQSPRPIRVRAFLYDKARLNLWKGMELDVDPPLWGVFFTAVGKADDLTLEVHNRLGLLLAPRRRGVKVDPKYKKPGGGHPVQVPTYPTAGMLLPSPSVIAWGDCSAPVYDIDTSDDRTIMASGPEVAHGIVNQHPTATSPHYAVAFSVSGYNDPYTITITDLGGTAVQVTGLRTHSRRRPRSTP